MTEIEEPSVASETDLFTALVERRSRYVFRVAYAVLRSVPDAEDVVQETFLKLYRSGAWREMREEQAFLAKTAWRLAVSRVPQRRSVEAAPLAWAGAGPEDQLLAADRHAAIHRLIDGLPGDLRYPLALSTVDEMNSRQIAEVMGIAEGTVRTRLMRARQILKLKVAAMEGK